MLILLGIIVYLITGFIIAGYYTFIVCVDHPAGRPESLRESSLKIGLAFFAWPIVVPFDIAKYILSMLKKIYNKLFKNTTS